jgi:predicted nucleic acid-binding Zn ribbon protein
MNRGKESRLKEAISDFINSKQLKTKYSEARLVQNWEAIVGKPIAAHTKSVQLRNADLILTFDASPLKQEMMHMSDKVIQAVNEFLGEPAVKSLIIR